MDITDAKSDRIELAMERFFQRTDSISLGRVGIAIWPDGHLEVSVASEWLPENVTEQTARADFAHAQQMSEHILTQLGSEFRRRVAELPRRYFLIDDYGNGSVALGYLDGDTVVWAPGFAVTR
jgi:hypothetical protein